MSDVIAKAPLRWHRLGTLNDCEYAKRGEPDPEFPYGYVGPVGGGWEGHIWHPAKQDWFDVQGAPFASRAAARRAVQSICDALWTGTSIEPIPSGNSSQPHALGDTLDA